MTSLFINKDGKLPHYTEKLMRVISEIDNLKDGVHHVVIEHDDWCPALKGGKCCCSPYIHKVPRFPKYGF